MNKRAGDVEVAYPLFQTESGGSNPTSAHDFYIEEISKTRFLELNRKWHSRLPICTNCFCGVCYGAIYQNVIYAVAWWSHPIAQNRLKDGKSIYELRRMAINDKCPKNTASFMISIMIKLLKKKLPYLKKLISYQDTEVHNGTIYKASGWTPIDCGKFCSWHNRKNRSNLSTSDKIRWEINLNKD